MTMQVAVTHSSPNLPRTMRASALSSRLDAVNEAVFASLASQAFKDGIVKMGVAYATFLVETMEGVCFLPEEAAEKMFKYVEDHCTQLESAFPSPAEGVN
jgi:hypothetical protein